VPIQNQGAQKTTPRFVRWPELREILGGPGRTTVWRWELRGLFPKRVSIGPRTVGWLESDVCRWIEDRAHGGR